MPTSIADGRGDARPPCRSESNGGLSRETVSRLMRRATAHSPESWPNLEPARHLTTSQRANARSSGSGYLSAGLSLYRTLRKRWVHFKNEFRHVVSESPQYFGTGRIGEIVPPIAGTALRTNVGSPSLLGHLFVADAWHCVVSRFLTEKSIVLDIGCGCGKTARTLVYHPYIKQYIGFDVIPDNIDWCLRTIAPVATGRFEFHCLDVYSQTYNPTGKLRGIDVVFPAADGSIDFAFAASVFTHLLEGDAKHYLQEVKRTLAPTGVLLASIHTNPAAGHKYSGRENRIDVDPEYFIKLAGDAGLELVEKLGDLCGQAAFLFKAPATNR
jgi:SAM-dependent methyltransferase